MTARRTAVVFIGSEIGLAALFGITGMMHGFHGTAYAQGPRVACQEEDGNTDGRPCEWTDPDTGNRFYVDSSNYRGVPMA